MTDAATAARALGLIDLTNLEDGCTEADIRALAERAETPHGSVAALCVWPDFVELAAASVDGRHVGIATVVNFPGGGDDLADVVALTKRCTGAGATEIDTVIPYRSMLADDGATVTRHVETVRVASGNAILKCILETGELGDEALVRRASRRAIEAGADFIKTSTGKVAVNATPEAARWMLEEIASTGRSDVGFKPAGGIRTVEDAAAYLAIADEIMGEAWATPETFRFGASSLLGNVLEALGEGRGDGGTGY